MTSTNASTGPSTDAPAPADALILGASFAGLAAATALGRSLRDVLVVDGGPARNAPRPARTT